jgi:hypothetical protein
MNKGNIDHKIKRSLKLGSVGPSTRPVLNGNIYLVTRICFSNVTHGLETLTTVACLHAMME